jgi:hypothetical protein
MKAQERHELRENDLSGWLQYGLWAFLREYGSYIFLVLALAFLGFQLWRRHEISKQNAIDAAWADFRALPDIGQQDYLSKDFPDRAQRLIDEHPDIKMLRAEAYLKLGNFYDKAKLDPRLLQDLKITGSETLDKAIAAYNNALAEEPNDQLIGPKAHLGIAGAEEDRGGWDKAIEQYKMLTDPAGKYASNPYLKLAQEKVKNIDARRSAPRLAEMIPAPAPARPASALPELPGVSGFGSIPGLSAPNQGTQGVTIPNLTLPNQGSTTTPSPIGDLFSAPPAPPASGPAPSSINIPGLSITPYNNGPSMPAPPASAPSATQP